MIAAIQQERSEKKARRRPARLDQILLTGLLAVFVFKIVHHFIVGSFFVVIIAIGA